MLLRSTAALGMGFVLGLASPALAVTTIDFEATGSGVKAEGFSATGAPELSFFSAFGSGLQVGDFTPQSDGIGLAVFSDTPNFLIGSFSSPVDFLSLMFGNDDACCSQAGDTALLKTFLGCSAVGSTSLMLNRNDALDQTISFGQIGGSQIFDRFEFSFANSAGAPINLIEAVDNMAFNTASPVGPVPEPATWLMMLFGFGAVGSALRRSRKDSVQVRLAF